MSTGPDLIAHQRRSTPENIENIKESVGEIAQTERERLMQTLGRGKDRVHEVQVRFEDYVRHNPVRSLMIAAGAGAALGYVLARRR